MQADEDTALYFGMVLAVQGWRAGRGSRLVHWRRCCVHGESSGRQQRAVRTVKCEVEYDAITGTHRRAALVLVFYGPHDARLAPVHLLGQPPVMAVAELLCAQLARRSAHEIFVKLSLKSFLGQLCVMAVAKLLRAQLLRHPG